MELSPGPKALATPVPIQSVRLLPVAARETPSTAMAPRPTGPAKGAAAIPALPTPLPVSPLRALSTASRPYRAEPMPPNALPARGIPVVTPGGTARDAIFCGGVMGRVGSIAAFGRSAPSRPTWYLFESNSNALPCPYCADGRGYG